MSYDLNCTISILHDHNLGFDAQSNPRQEGFPYLLRKPGNQSTGQSPDSASESLEASDQATGTPQGAAGRDAAAKAASITEELGGRSGGSS